MTFTKTTELDQDRTFLPLARTRNKLLIVRPVEYRASGVVTMHQPDGTDAVFADIALLDAIPEAENELGDKFPGFAAGEQFRNQMILPGYLKGTWKRYIGHTLIGTTYFGPPTKGKPPIMWMDLADNADCVARGQVFMAAHPEFLVPVAAQITPAAPPPPSGPPAYVPDHVRQAGGYAPTQPPSPPASAYTQPVPASHPYTQPDPYSAGSDSSTLDAMRRMAQQGVQGGPPF